MCLKEGRFRRISMCYFRLSTFNFNPTNIEKVSDEKLATSKMFLKLTSKIDIQYVHLRNFGLQYRAFLRIQPQI